MDCGNYDEVAAMRTLVEIGFDGLVIPDHGPTILDDTDWGHRSRGYTAGYLRGLANVVSAERLVDTHRGELR